MDFHRTLLSGIKLWVLDRINTSASAIEAKTEERISSITQEMNNKIPVNLSELNNDAGYALKDELPEHTWASLPDKPFGEVTVMGDTLTWDGKRNGSYDLFIPYMEYFFISDMSISQEELFAGEFKSVLSTGEVFEYKYTQQDLYGEPTKSYEYYKNGVAIITNDAPELHEVKPGIYFYYAEIDSKGRECYVTSFTYKGHNVFPMVEVKQIDEKYLPDSVKGGGVTSWNDLTDKPFGDETEELFHWNGSAEVEDGYINFYFPFDVSILTTGKEYLVTLNGTPYALEFQQVYMGIYRLQKTGIDFYIEFSGNKGSFYFTEDNFTGTTADLSISGLVRTYMPEEFLPDSVQLKPYIISISYSVGNSYSVTDGNLDEAEKAHSIGREVYVYISNYGAYKAHTINRWKCSCIFIYVDDDSDDVKAVRLEIDESLNVTVRELTLSTL